MDWRRNRSLFVCAILLLIINVDCSSIPFGNRRFDILSQMPPPVNPQPSNPSFGITPCLKDCIFKRKPNPCVGYFGRRGCPPTTLPPQAINPFVQFDKVSSSGFGLQSWNSIMLPPRLSRTTTTTATTTVTVAKTTAIHKKDVTEEQNNMLTTTASPPPPPTTKATGGITVNPDPFWMMFVRK